MANLTIALAGNPNSGKSTVFNALTGLHQHTGNWPGKTVEKKTGRCQYQDLNIEFVDLPGTYSLSAYSPDEKVARDFLIGEHPDGVICVVDATNLERNLYLVVQLLELGIPVSVALNMMDQAQTVGIDVDCSSLSRLLGGVPVIATAASRSKGLNELLATTVDYLVQQSSGESGLPGVAGKCHCDNGDLKGFQVNYGSEIELAIDRLELTAESSRVPLNGYCRRWMALELLEGDLDLTNEAATLPGGELMIKAASCEIDQLESEFGDHVDMITADARYTAVSGISRQVMKRNENNGPTLTERVDRFATNRLVGLPIFLAIMYLVFRLVIDVSAPYLDWVDSLISGPVSLGIGYALSQIGALCSRINYPVFFLGIARGLRISSQSSLRYGSTDAIYWTAWEIGYSLDVRIWLRCSRRICNANDSKSPQSFAYCAIDSLYVLLGTLACLCGLCSGLFRSEGQHRHLAYVCDRRDSCHSHGIDPFTHGIKARRKYGLRT
jgi:ferrous iron transport protein B